MKRSLGQRSSSLPLEEDSSDHERNDNSYHKNNHHTLEFHPRYNPKTNKQFHRTSPRVVFPGGPDNNSFPIDQNTSSSSPRQRRRRHPQRTPTPTPKSLEGMVDAMRVLDNSNGSPRRGIAISRSFDDSDPRHSSPRLRGGRRRTAGTTGRSSSILAPSISSASSSSSSSPLASHPSDDEQSFSFNNCDNNDHDHDHDPTALHLDKAAAAAPRQRWNNARQRMRNSQSFCNDNDDPPLTTSSLHTRPSTTTTSTTTSSKVRQRRSPHSLWSSSRLAVRQRAGTGVVGSTTTASIATIGSNASNTKSHTAAISVVMGDGSGGHTAPIRHGLYRQSPPDARSSSSNNLLNGSSHHHHHHRSSISSHGNGMTFAPVVSKSRLSFRRTKKKRVRRRQQAACLVLIGILFGISFFGSFVQTRIPTVQSTAAAAVTLWRTMTQRKNNNNNNNKEPPMERRTVARRPVRPGTVRGAGGASPQGPKLTPSRAGAAAATPLLPSPRLRGAGTDGKTILTDKHTYHFERFSRGAPVCTDLDSPDEVTFTLVTQLSLNRLWMMEHHCARWPHAISMAVFVEDAPALAQANVQEQLTAMGCDRDRVTLSVVTGYSAEEYPVNVLRNTALRQVRTSHVVYVDVDFWPSTNLSTVLDHHRAILAAKPKHALVTPAFQLNRQCAEYKDCRDDNIPRMPHTRNDLSDRMMEHQLTAFDPTNRGGHGSTRYVDWLGQREDELLSIECVNSNRYEPYLVFRYCHDLPPFQEVFSGYGKNKMSWVMQLRRAGYQLSQLGGAYVVHYPHLDSAARLHWNGGENGAQLSKPQKGDDMSTFKRAQVDRTFVEFRRWLSEHVPDESVLHKCEDAMDDEVKLWIKPDEEEVE